MSATPFAAVAIQTARIFAVLGDVLDESSEFVVYDDSTDALETSLLDEATKLATLLEDAGVGLDVFDDARQALDTLVVHLRRAATQLAATLTDDSPDIDQVVAAVQGMRTAITKLDSSLLRSDAPPAGELVAALVGHLVVRFLERDHLAVFQLLALVGVVDEPAVRQRGPGQLRLDRLPQVLTDPATAVAATIAWETGGFASDWLMRTLQRLALALGRTARVVEAPDHGLGGHDPDAAGTSDELLSVVTTLAELEAGEIYAGLLPLIEPQGERGVVAYVAGEVTGETAVAIGGDWEVLLAGELATGPQVGFALTPSGAAIVTDDEDTVPAGGGLRLSFARTSSERVVLIDTDAVTVDAASFGLGAALKLGDGLTARIELCLDDGLLRIGMADGDGFLAACLPDDLDVGFDLKAAVGPDGLTIGGETGLGFTLLPALKAGPFTLERIDVALHVDEDGLTFTARADAVIELGALTASVGGVGAAVDLDFPKAEDGHVGPFDSAVRFVPPSALGLSIDAGPVSGGGFIDHDPEAGRYEGGLQLQLAEVGISALGLLETELPDGAEGYSLLVVLHSEFPPIALPFGFVLTSVGGLLALNRRVDVDELRQQFASGAVGRILAPEDPIGNAPALLAELGEVFPATEGIFVVGPTLQLEWTSIVRFDVGVFVELPGPSKAVLLGSVRAAIDNPTGKRLLQLRLDVIGVLDSAKTTLEFDAVLIDSQLLEVFELTGGAAFRLNWGPTPHVVLSVGGFHPRFDPAPLAFPSSLTRITMTRGRRQDAFYLRFEGYFAITANSLQLGASAEMVLRAGKIVAEGSFGFDVLVRFQPFGFELDLRAGMRIAYRGHTLAGVKVKGTLSGPGPVEFTGKISFEILFIDISWRGSFQFGSPTPARVTPVANPADALLPELSDPRNFVAVGGDDAAVILELDAHQGEQPLVSPLGQLGWRQSRAPLGLLLELFEGAPVSNPATLAVSHDLGGRAVAQRDWFAPGMYVELSDAEKLDRSGFEELDAGVFLAADDEVVSAGEALTVEFDEYRLPADNEESLKRNGRVLPGWLLDAADGFVPAHQVAAAAVGMTRTLFEVRSPETGALRSQADLSEAQAHQLARYDAASAVVTVAGDLVEMDDFDLENR